MGHGVLVQPLTNKMTHDQNTPRLSTPDANAPNVGYEVFSPCVAAAMLRRSCIQSLGGFDEDYFCYVEDVDLAFRLRLIAPAL